MYKNLKIYISKNNLIKIGIIFIVSVILIVSELSNIYAFDKTGSISIKYKIVDGDKELFLPNVEFQLYNIGTWVDGKIELNEDFKESDITIDNNETYSSIINKSKQLCYFAKKSNIVSRNGITNDLGIIRYNKLDIGVYLIYQTESKFYNGKYYNSLPMLISIPTQIENEVIYDIKSEVKTEDNPTGDNPSEDNPSEDNPTGDNPTGDNPSEDNPNKYINHKVKTGDESKIELFLFLFIISFGAYFIINRNKKY